MINVFGISINQNLELDRIYIFKLSSTRQKVEIFLCLSIFALYNLFIQLSLDKNIAKINMNNYQLIRYN